MKIKKLVIGSIMSALTLSHVMSVNAAEANVTFRHIDIANLSTQTINESLIYDVPKDVVNGDANYALVYKKILANSEQTTVQNSIGSNPTQNHTKSIESTLPNTGENVFPATLLSLTALVGGTYLLYKNKRSGKYLLVALVAGGTLVGTSVAYADFVRLANDVSLSISIGNTISYVPQEIEGYEYVGYIKDGIIVEETTVEETTVEETTAEETTTEETSVEETTAEETTAEETTVEETTAEETTVEETTVEETTQAPTEPEVTEPPVTQPEVTEPPVTDAKPSPDPSQMVSWADWHYVGYGYTWEEADQVGINAIANTLDENGNRVYSAYFVQEHNGIIYTYAQETRQ